MRRFLILLALLFLPAAMGYTQTVKQRVGKLEKRVTKNEKRIKALEKNTGKALAACPVIRRNKICNNRIFQIFAVFFRSLF